jgi:GT2 family glycosyltransferase
MLDACLRSIHAGTCVPEEIIVVDNASTDDTREWVRGHYPRIRLVENTGNAFASAARNLGARHATREFLLFVDDDNDVDPRMVEELVRLAASDPRIGVAGPKMYYADTDRTLLWTGASISLLTSHTSYRGADTKDTGQYEDAVETEHVPNVMLIRRDLFLAVGGFDPVYRIMYEEAEFGMQARRAGYTVMYCPKAVTWHKVQAPTRGVNPFRLPMRAYFLARNRGIYMRRFSGGWRLLIFLLVFYPLFTAYFLHRALRVRDWASARLHLTGTWHGVVYVLTRRTRCRY